MVNVRLPNVRRFFVPDPGYVLVDADLSGADAQIVAWEADDEDLKAAFKAGAKIHVHNARAMADLFEDDVASMTDAEIKAHPTIYRAVKAGCHALNYGASEFALMHNIGWTRDFAKEFAARWFYAHPKIKDWHHRYDAYLHGTRCWNCDEWENLTPGLPCPTCGARLGRTVKNAFGFRRIYFERVDGLLPAALAWTPQSSVAFCTELGWTSIAHGPEYMCQFGHAEMQTHSWRDWLVNPDAYNKWHNVVQFLIQVHDSIVFQVPYAYEDDIPEIVNDMLVKVPYPDPLVIPMGWKASRRSWGDA